MVEKFGRLVMGVFPGRESKPGARAVILEAEMWDFQFGAPRLEVAFRAVDINTITILAFLEEARHFS